MVTHNMVLMDIFVHHGAMNIEPLINGYWAHFIDNRLQTFFLSHKRGNHCKKPVICYSNGR